MTNAVGALLEDFILQESLTILNQWPCPPTFHLDMGHQSWIDLSLSTGPIASAVEGWRVLSDVDFDSDHSPVAFRLQPQVDRTTKPRLDWCRTQ